MKHTQKVVVLILLLPLFTMLCSISCYGSTEAGEKFLAPLREISQGFLGQTSKENNELNAINVINYIENPDNRETIEGLSQNDKTMLIARWRDAYAYAMIQAFEKGDLEKTYSLYQQSLEGKITTPGDQLIYTGGVDYFWQKSGSSQTKYHLGYLLKIRSKDEKYVGSTHSSGSVADAYTRLISAMLVTYDLPEVALKLSKELMDRAQAEQHQNPRTIGYAWSETINILFKLGRADEAYEYYKRWLEEWEPKITEWDYFKDRLEGNYATLKARHAAEKNSDADSIFAGGSTDSADKAAADKAAADKAAADKTAADLLKESELGAAESDDIWLKAGTELAARHLEFASNPTDKTLEAFIKAVPHGNMHGDPAEYVSRIRGEIRVSDRLDESEQERLIARCWEFEGLVQLDKGLNEEAGDAFRKAAEIYRSAGCDDAGDLADDFADNAYDTDLSDEQNDDLTDGPEYGRGGISSGGFPEFSEADWENPEQVVATSDNIVIDAMKKILAGDEADDEFISLCKEYVGITAKAAGLMGREPGEYKPWVEAQTMLNMAYEQRSMVDEARKVADEVAKLGIDMSIIKEGIQKKLGLRGDGDFASSTADDGSASGATAKAAEIPAKNDDTSADDSSKEDKEKAVKKVVPLKQRGPCGYVHTSTVRCPICGWLDGRDE